MNSYFYIDPIKGRIDWIKAYSDKIEYARCSFQTAHRSASLEGKDFFTSLEENCLIDTYPLGTKEHAELFAKIRSEVATAIADLSIDPYSPRMVILKEAEAGLNRGVGVDTLKRETPVALEDISQTVEETTIEPQAAPPVYQKPDTQPPKKTKKKSNKLLFILLGAGVLVAIIVAVALFFLKNIAKTQQTQPIETKSTEISSEDVTVSESDEDVVKIAVAASDLASGALLSADTIIEKEITKAEYEVLKATTYISADGSSYTATPTLYENVSSLYGKLTNRAISAGFVVNAEDAVTNENAKITSVAVTVEVTPEGAATPSTYIITIPDNFGDMLYSDIENSNGEAVLERIVEKLKETESESATEESTEAQTTGRTNSGGNSNRQTAQPQTEAQTTKETTTEIQAETQR